MRYFPMFLQLQDQPVLVIGGGEVASRKIRLLRDAGARVQVVAQSLSAEVQTLQSQGALDWIDTMFAVEQVRAVRLVVAATDDDALNALVSRSAQLYDTPVNVVDSPDLSTYIVPSIVDRDPITVAISTAGTAPVLARRLRGQLEALLPHRLGQLATLAGKWRTQVKNRLTSLLARRRFWESFFASPAASRILDDKPELSDIDLDQQLLEHNAEGAAGEVTLVGAGPGDPELLTIKALRVLQEADVVVYDRLVSEAVLELSRRDATRIYMGKRSKGDSHTQSDINQLLVRHARSGKRVVRLKGGDPFVFGRGGEELAAVAAAGISTRVVPGLTAATACAASVGIPLTHRDLAHACTLVTGHRPDGEPAIAPAQLADSKQTVAFYMGLHGAAQTAMELIDAGRSGATPVAVIENGTLPHERVVYGTLATLGSLVKTYAIKAPALIIVGDVVALANAQQPTYREAA